MYAFHQIFFGGLKLHELPREPIIIGIVFELCEELVHIVSIYRPDL